MLARASSYADRKPADPAQLLLRSRHSGAGEIARGADDVAEMADYINADSLAFLSIDGLYRRLGEDIREDSQPQHCDACFTGDYPTRLTDHEDTEPADQLALLAERYA
jgi:hypothetical protein